MRNKGLLVLLLLFGQQISAAVPSFAGISPHQNSGSIAELAVTANERNAVVCSNFVQNCTINIGTTGCVNPPGFITVTNNSIVNARNIAASSTNANYLSYVLQNNRCPSILKPKASCTISFTSTNASAFYVPNVVVKGSNTNSTFFNINAIQCATPQTGVLVPIPGSPFASGNPNNLAATPNSKFLYVTNFGGGVTGYSINPTTGVLVPLAGSPYNDGTSYSGIAVSPNGLYLYVTDSSNNLVAQFTINQTTGVLTPVNTYPTGSSTPVFIGLTPNGQFAYVANLNGHTVSAYTVNSTTGVLTTIAGSPFSIPPASSQPISLTSSPNGQFLYVIDFFGMFGGKVHAFTIDQGTGALTALAGSPYQTGTYPSSVITNSTGSFIYVAAGNGPGLKASAFNTSIWIYSANTTTGALTDVTPIMPDTAASGIALTPDDKFAYDTRYQDDLIIASSVDPTSGLLTIMPNSPYATASGPEAIIVTPNGLFVYVINTSSNTISGYVIH
ncbi:MAG: 6-phosphogluconolactonase [Legionella sp.]|uniref:lactonase family protein n=1 Tax=Legionella sp. TaxID=459 RepID=UPI003D0E878E